MLELIEQLRKQMKEKEYADPLMCGLVNRILADLKSLEHHAKLLSQKETENK